MARGEVKTLYFADGTTVTPPENVPFTNAELDGATVSNYLDFDHVATPLNPPASTLRIYAKSDNSLYAKTTAGVELPIGSGSGTGQVTFFYDDLSNGSASNWVSYDDGSVAVPVDGTGGTPSTLTVTASTSSPLRGTYSLQIAKSAADGRGEGIAAAFTIPNGYLQAAKRTISFLWDGSGANYVAGDMACYVYDVTNSTLITPSVAALPAAKVPIQISWDSSSSSSYRLIFHVTTTNAASYNVKLDDITVGPGQIVNSAASGYLGSIAGFTVSANGSKSFTIHNQCWRKNNILTCKFALEGNATASGSGATTTFTFNLPSGYTIDATALPDQAAVSSSRNNAGYFTELGISAANTYTDQKQIYPANTTSFRFLSVAPNVVIRTTDLNQARVMDIQGEFSVPIAEWAGAPNYAGANDVEYVSNSSTSSSDDTTSFAYGPQGSLVPTITASAAATVIEKRVRFLTSFQAGEAPLVLYQKGGTGPFVPVDTSYDYMNTLQNTGAAARYYGISARSINSTDVSIYFGAAGSKPTGTTYGAVGANFPANASDRYMVVKARAGAAVGFGAATSNSMGLVKAMPVTVFNVPVTGPITTSANFRVARVGDVVTVTWPQVVVTGVSVSAAITLDFTSMPSWARPFAQIVDTTFVRENGILQTISGLILFPTSGNGTVQKTYATSTFAANAGNTGFETGTTSYVGSAW